ncbi:MAG: 4'-phosphopantetheinyl transferase [Acidimicrobiia bacterium]
MEKELIGRAVPNRQQEFTAGRNCARQAMRNLGLPANQAEAPISIGSHREPIFPSGVIGSISHCDDFCAAVAARAGNKLVGLGLDVEVNRPIDGDVASLIMRPHERYTWESAFWLNASPLTTAFSIKEAFFQAVFLECRRYLDFGDAWLMPSLSDSDGDFSIAMMDPGLKNCLEGLRVIGRCAADAHNVYSFVALVR